MADRHSLHNPIDRLAAGIHSLRGPSYVPLDLAVVDSTIEELRVTEEALIAAKEDAERERSRYYELFEFAPDPYLVTTPVGRVQEANQAAMAFLGVRNNFLIGKPLSLYVHPDDHLLFSHLLARLRQALRAEATLRMKPRERAEWVASVTAGAVRGDAGGLTGIRWIIRDVTQQDRAERELRSSRRRVRAMSSKLALAEERERRRIAIDIHDHISQSLALIKLRLGMIRAASAPEQQPPLDEVRGLMSQVIAQTRSLTFELSPAVLYELGLGAAIEWLLEQRGGCGVKFEFQDDARDVRLPRDIAITLFQAVRELLANLIKHSGATAATFRLAGDRKSVTFDVIDNGTGFDVKEVLSRKPQHQGLGLANLRERMAHLGGSIDISSAPGQGTRVSLAVPLYRSPKSKKPRRSHAIEHHAG